MKRLVDNKNGFTLIEVLISVVIIAMMSTVITQVFFTTIRTNTKTELLKEIKQNGSAAIATMERDIRNARDASVSDDIAGPWTCDGSPGTVLRMTNPDNSQTIYTCGVKLVTGTQPSRIQMFLLPALTPTPIPIDQGYITGTDVTLGTSGSNGDCLNDHVTFTCTTPTDAPKTVSVSFTLSQKEIGNDTFEQAATTTFTTTVALRNL